MLTDDAELLLFTVNPYALHLTVCSSLLRSMSARNLVAKWGCVARGTGRPYRLWIFRDEQGVVHRSETTKDIVNIDDVPEQPLDHRRYQPAWLPGWTKWQGDPNGVWIKQIVYEEPLVSAFQWTCFRRSALTTRNDLTYLSLPP